MNSIPQSKPGPPPPPLFSFFRASCLPMERRMLWKMLRVSTLVPAVLPLLLLMRQAMRPARSCALSLLAVCLSQTCHHRHRNHHQGCRRMLLRESFTTYSTGMLVSKTPC
jgi:hypothetical protein